MTAIQRLVIILHAIRKTISPSVGASPLFEPEDLSNTFVGEEIEQAALTLHHAQAAVVRA